MALLSAPPAVSMAEPTLPTISAIFSTCLAKSSPHSRKAFPPSPSHVTLPARCLSRLPIFSNSPLALVRASPFRMISPESAPMTMPTMRSKERFSKPCTL
ncbi:hypothetical protein CD790_05495 [Streptomyces sp. SAJ15]|nr:hypothetical protein CD790_05495 [Streptomyces sp. SAJ15]